LKQLFKNLDNALRKDDGCSTEMDYIDKLSPALISKYGGVYEAQQELGNVDDIKKVFINSNSTCTMKR
jgi:hypothetical protein